MKKIILPICLTLSIFSIQFLFSQTPTWKNITPAGWTGNFKVMTFLKGGTLIAISDSGYIYHSTDTAKTWTVAKSPVTQVEDMKFYPDGKRGYIVSGTSLFYTSDGGYNWAKKTITGTTGMTYFFCIYIKSEDTLLLGTRNVYVGSKIMLSADAGSSWKQVASNLFLGGNNAYSALLTFFFDTPSHGYALGQGYYAITSDGGKTWANTSEGTTTYNCSATLNSQNEILVYTAGCITLSKTQDISNPETGMCSDGFEGGVVRLGTTKICISADDHGNMHRSTDDGYTWTTTILNSNKKFKSVVVVDNNTAIIYGNELTMFKTIDGGVTWQKLVHGGGEGFSKIVCKTVNECFITGKAGRLFRTQDGGNSWTWQDLGVSNPLYEITFPTQDTGYVSANKLIFRTTDGGFTWQSFKLKTGGSVLNFPTKDVGYIGYTNMYPYIYKTTDAGVTWNMVNQEMGGGGISFLSSNHGICDGTTDGTILYTNDGGQTWTEKNLNYQQNTSAKEIIPLKKGWMILSIRGISPKFVDIYTCDTNLHLSLLKSVNNYGGGLKQINDSSFFFGGSDSTYFSKDYGKTWTSYKYWTGINDIYFPSSQISYAFAVGSIYKSYFSSNFNISNIKITNKTITALISTISEVKTVNVLLKLVNNVGDTVYFVAKTIENGIPLSITLPNSITDGTYTIVVIPEDTLLYNTTQSQSIIIKTTSSEITEINPTIKFKVRGNRIECDCNNYEIYNMLGQQMSKYSELQTGIYILKCNTKTQIIIIKP